MSNKKIEKLTPEQESLIPVYWEKWRKTWLSIKRIDKEKVAEVVKAAYAMIGLLEPQIIFCDSPYAACNLFFNHLSPQVIEDWCNNPDNTALGHLLFFHIFEQLNKPLDEQIGLKVYEQYEQLEDLMTYSFQGAGEPFNRQMFNHLSEQVESWGSEDNQIFEQSRYIKSLIDVSFQPENHYWVAGFDFCISVLGLSLPEKTWKVYQSLVEECGWVINNDKFCVICDRPTKLSFDSEGQLHAEAEPAIQYADGFSVYAYHGVRLTEKYSKLHPTQWQANWLLEEDYFELRQLLIQTIGYEHIIKELQAIELDYYQEYTLLKIDSDVSFEPIYLLKVTDPDTGKIDVKRVSANVKSVQEAIDFLEFGVIF